MTAQTQTVFGYPVYVEIEIGGRTHEVKGAIRVTDTLTLKPELDLNAFADVVNEKTRPCQSCGTRPGEARRS